MHLKGCVIFSQSVPFWHFDFERTMKIKSDEKEVKELKFEKKANENEESLLLFS